MGDVDQVAKALEKWAVEEMGFRNIKKKDGIDTNKSIDLSGICLGPMADIWMYVIKHVKSEATVQTIKGNLSLHSRAQIEDPQKVKLVTQKEKLEQEIADLRKTNGVLYDSLTEAKTSIQKQEVELRKKQLAFRDLKRSSVLLNLVKNNVGDNIKSLNKNAKEIEKQFLSLAPQLENEADLERYKIDIENMCKLMQNSLNELLKEDPNIEKINSTKMAVGNNLATLLETLPHPLFMKLIQEQQAADVSAINHKDFRLPQQSNTAPDFIPDNVQPLQKLLYEISWYHTETATRAEDAKKQAVPLKQELEKIKANILQSLQMRFDAEDPKLADEHFKAIEMEIQLASRKGAIESLRKNLEELENFCTLYEARQADIEQKILTIESNSRLSDHLTALICTLARKCSNSPALLQQLVNQSLRMINEDFPALHNTLSNFINSSQGNFVEKELELYRQLKPSQLFNVRMDTKLVPVNRLSLHRLLLTADSDVSGSHLEKALKCLGIPCTLPVFRVLERVGEKQLEMRKMQQALKWHETRNSEMIEKHGLVWLENGAVRYKDLAKKLEDSWNAQKTAILPSLELRRKRMDEALKYVADVDVALHEWCNEPAKFIDTGRTVNGKTLDQWNTEWKKSLTLCRKKAP
ncbi:hypothetical protein GHT06_022483 [Daphnia sinensis]|uniref:HAUS augmin-like complex subunit 5 n=1 Tax=Daphnia sinensis TaxID=1820382 RepID=A0AAD5KXX3_9CRUS|nr:hypothetical protein GHT06_022483 [Daphnia sinensis]